MQNDDSGESIEREPVEQRASGEPINPPLPPDDPSTPAAQAISRQEVRSEVQGIEDRVKRAELWMIWFTAAIAFSGICGVVVGYLQWREIRAGSTDTHTLAQAADTQAKKMTDMSTAADKIRQAAENMVTQDQRIADNAEKALNASNKQSKASLDASIASSRLEQRAWVGVTDLHLVGAIEAGKPISAEAVFTNTGRTIARDVRTILIVHTSVGAIDIDEYAKHPEEPLITPFGLKQGVFNLFPNQTMNLPAQSGTPDAQAVEAIRTGGRILYVFGWISYTDVFSRPHITKFCGVYLPPIYLAATGSTIPVNAKISTCSSHNYAD